MPLLPDSVGKFVTILETRLMISKIQVLIYSIKVGQNRVGGA